jgi:hypothetical protein
MFSTKSFLFSAIGAGTATGQPIALNTGTLAGAFLPNPMLSFLVGQQVARSQIPPAPAVVRAPASSGALPPGGNGAVAPVLTADQRLAQALAFWDRLRQPVPDLREETADSLRARDPGVFVFDIQWVDAPNEDSRSGDFVSQSPSAESIAYPGTAITVNFSKGSGFKLPSLDGLDYGSLVRRASAYEVGVVRVDRDVEKLPAGIVIRYISDSTKRYFPGEEVSVEVQFEDPGYRRAYKAESELVDR